MKKKFNNHDDNCYSINYNNGNKHCFYSHKNKIIKMQNNDDDSGVNIQKQKQSKKQDDTMQLATTLRHTNKFLKNTRKQLYKATKGYNNFHC